ncbi:MAG: NAD(P)H-dependent oxidoreductase subunit E [Actinomycetota bacterium]
MAVLTEEHRAEAERIRGRYPLGRERSAIMPLLYLVQSVEGRVTPDGLREVADLVGATTAEVQAVASFYTMLRLRRTGEHLVAVCTNLSCALRGANELYAAALEAIDADATGTSPDGKVTVVEEECLGACDAAPLVQVNVANLDRVTREHLLTVLEGLRRDEVPTAARGTTPGGFRAASRILAGLEGGVATEPRPVAAPARRPGGGH